LVAVLGKGIHLSQGCYLYSKKNAATSMIFNALEDTTTMFNVYDIYVFSEMPYLEDFITPPFPFVGTLGLAARFLLGVTVYHLGSGDLCISQYCELSGHILILDPGNTMLNQLDCMHKPLQ
jgi:hypothetical protein